jgi:hypothetical protein
VSGFSIVAVVDAAGLLLSATLGLLAGLLPHADSVTSASGAYSSAPAAVIVRNMVLSVGYERRGIDAATQLSDESVSGTREFRDP